MITSEMQIDKEEHLFRSDQKLAWFGYGEWVEEFDQIEFTYEYYKCLVVRVVKKEPFAVDEHYFGGHLCGYVQIPKRHPLYSKDWDEIDLDCHGGITCNENHEEHWIGFDCAHSGDYVPSMEKFRKENKINELFPIPKESSMYSLFHPVYRNILFVMNECRIIVDQLIEIEKNK